MKLRIIRPIKKTIAAITSLVHIKTAMQNIIKKKLIVPCIFSIMTLYSFLARKILVNKGYHNYA